MQLRENWQSNHYYWVYLKLFKFLKFLLLINSLYLNWKLDYYWFIYLFWIHFPDFAPHGPMRVAINLSLYLHRRKPLGKNLPSFLICIFGICNLSFRKHSYTVVPSACTNHVPSIDPNLVPLPSRSLISISTAFVKRNFSIQPWLGIHCVILLILPELSTTASKERFRAFLQISPLPLDHSEQYIFFNE